MAPTGDPCPLDPAFPRWSPEPFPPYRFVPGRSPHPRRDPRGHAHGAPEPPRERLDPAAWAASALYRRGVDLFNFAYWWEAHEVFEALWHGAGKRGPEADFFQALVQLAASELKRVTGKIAPARALAERARGRLAALPSPFFGVDVRALDRDAGARLAGTREIPLQLRLDTPALPASDPSAGSSA